MLQQNKLWMGSRSRRIFQPCGTNGACVHGLKTVGPHVRRPCGRFAPLKESTTHPTEQFQKGLGQTFRTRNTHPLDVSLYKPHELEYDPRVGRCPIIVCMEVGTETNRDPNKVQSQTTSIKLGLNEDGSYMAIPIKQKIQIGTTPYELQEIFGIDQQAKPGEAPSDMSRECVICMSEARDTTVLPCRHMCMCSDCARRLRLQTNKCPICRTNIEQLLQIKVWFPRLVIVLPSRC